ERWYTHVEAVADFQRLDQVLAQIEVNPQVAKIDQGDQRHAGRHVFARLDITLVDLRGNRSVDRHLIDDGFNGFDIGYCLADIGFGDLTLLARLALDPPFRPGL